MRRKTAIRSLALFLSLSLGLSVAPAFALRSQTTEGAGLEEQLAQAFQDNDPAKAVRTIVSRFSQLTAPPVPRTPPLAATGLEEKIKPEDAQVLIIHSDQAVLASVRQVVEDQLKMKFGEANPLHQVHALEIRGEVNRETTELRRIEEAIQLYTPHLIFTSLNLTFVGQNEALQVAGYARRTNSSAAVILVSDPEFNAAVDPGGEKALGLEPKKDSLRVEFPTGALQISKRW